MSNHIPLRANVVPYSGVVGPSVMLVDDAGRARFLVLACGTTEGIEKEEAQAIVGRLADLINTHGLTVPERRPA